MLSPEKEIQGKLTADERAHLLTMRERIDRSFADECERAHEKRISLKIIETDCQLTQDHVDACLCPKEYRVRNRACRHVIEDHAGRALYSDPYITEANWLIEHGLMPAEELADFEAIQTDIMYSDADSQTAYRVEDEQRHGILRTDEELLYFRELGAKARILDAKIVAALKEKRERLIHIIDAALAA